jgi:hypothetical protein
MSAPSQPTHFPDRNPAGAEILDFAILSNVLSSHTVRTLSSLSTSDHSPILLTIRGPLETGKIKPNFIYREDNWKLFQNYLLNNLNIQCLQGNCSKSETDVAVRHLTDIINRASLFAIPLKRRIFRSVQIATSTCVLIQKETDFLHDVQLKLTNNMILNI